jgi:hypothetical protein
MLAVATVAHMSCAAAPDLPPALSDQEFWTLSTSLSEPAGEFVHPDNLVSNEAQFAQLTQRLRPRGGVYIGVGPEQNFSYIARLQPQLAFIVDIRHENRLLHLMYKALFEMSADRGEFLARLFSRERPAGINGDTSVDDLFARLAVAGPSSLMYDETRRLIRAQLVEARGFPLPSGDLRSMDESLNAFLIDGPDIRYGRALPHSPARPSYRELMTAKDLAGRARSYLGTEDAFALVKALHLRNAIVPVVGNFAGPQALRRVGEYIRQQQQQVSAFYSSNVEVYLTRDERRTFCATLQTLPHDEGTWFISAKELQPLTVKLKGCATIEPSLHWPP